ncbi:hypothetical protein C8T65DRAFT_739612 [Cerioporus squamosus]|nr:hypothetical protein C8T65DRAFT_739612 [Cerioporus squamosus]
MASHFLPGNQSVQTELPASTIDHLRDLWSQAGELIEDLAASRGVTNSYQQPLASLKTVFQDAVGVAQMLHNERLPIYRLPPEVMIRIFSFVRISVDDADSAHLRPVRWTFTVLDDRELHPLLLVCRRWRDLALSAPLLWSHVMAVRGMVDNYLARSASVPLTVYIEGYRVIDYHVQRSSIGKVRSRIRVLHINYTDSGIPSWMMGFLATLGAHQLEECNIDFHSTRSEGGVFTSYTVTVPDFRPRLTLFSGGSGNGGGERLRILRLAGVPFLPSNRFPDLTTLSLSSATMRTDVAGADTTSWSVQDLVDFLSGSPRLEELYIRNVQLERRSPDAVDQLLTSLPWPDSHWYTRLRITAIEFGSTMLHFVPSSGSGSLTIGLRVVNQRMRVDFNPQRELRALFDIAYPWCCAIEELWLELAEDDYYHGLGCILGRFPGLKRLVVSQPSYLSPGGWYARLADTLHLLRPTKTGNIACPALDTLCVSIPAYCKDVEAVKQVLLSRAQSHHVRRLVIGYSHMLELEVLAEVFSLEELVEEFVCEELPPVRRGTVLADWLLSIPKVFEDGGFHASWPKWDQGTLFLPSLSSG